jgi:hypothetical protein
MTIGANAGAAWPRIAVVIPGRMAVRGQGQPLAGQRPKPLQHGATGAPVHCGPIADEVRELHHKAGRGQVNA